MNKEDIGREVRHYEALLREELDKTVFTLNSNIQDCVEKIEYFQHQCDHKVEGSINFSVDEEGLCQYCGKSTMHLRGVT